MRGDWRDSIAPSLALFGSASTLLCCALPALLISIGAGDVMAGLTTAIPGIMWLSAHKDILFVLSGVLMAAEMAGIAPGEDVIAAYAQMLQPQGLASENLGKAHAMTDLTGFGIAGHLSGICEASGLAAEISLDAVPLMQGALALSEKGVRSSLYPDNVAGAGAVTGRKGPLADLMFDPQTAGGLLAAVPADMADELVKKLCLAGYPAARIGRMIEGPPAITLI